MTRDDFEAWWKYHKARFPGIVSWLAKMPADDSRAIMQAWAVTMRECDLAMAQRGTDQLARQDRLPAYERHPWVVRDYATKHKRYEGRDLGPKIGPGGVETFRCADCRDYGMVTVWHPMHYRQIRGHETPAPGRLYTCVLACHCDAGNYYPWLKRRKGVEDGPETVFDPELMLRPDPRRTLAEQWDDLVGFLLGMPAQGFQEFAAFGGDEAAASRGFGESIGEMPEF